MLFEVEEYSMSGEGRGGGSDVATFLGLELQDYSDDTIPMATGKNNAPVFFHEAKEPSSPVVECQPSLIVNRSGTGARLNCWSAEGTGILRVMDNAKRASTVPLQSGDNNLALREILKDKAERLLNKSKLTSLPPVPPPASIRGEQSHNPMKEQDRIE